MTTRSKVIAGLAAALMVSAGPAGAGDSPWLVNVQEIDTVTPLEIKLAYEISGSTTRIGAAVLYNNGAQNVIDVYNFSADANGVTVDDKFAGIATGDVFALGESCLQNGFFIVPYIDDFDVRALRWNDTNAFTVPVDTTKANHTTTDCVGYGADFAGIASLDFDSGDIDVYESLDSGASWDLGVSYSIGGDSIIGPFSGGFRPKSGPSPLPGGGTGLGITYQLGSGALHSVLLDPNDGSTEAGPLNWDSIAPHGSFIGNGFLKEIGGISLPSLGYAFGAANGGTAIGFSYLNLSDGAQGFQLLNTVTTTALGFQGLALEYSLAGDNAFVHTFSNRHVRLDYDLAGGTKTFEEIPGYPFADLGGAVDAVAGQGRLFVAGGGNPVGFRGTGPNFQIATMDPDPAVMQGVPLGSVPGGPGDAARPIPAFDALGLVLLMMLIGGLAWMRMRSAG